jgi:hypothetical protein
MGQKPRPAPKDVPDSIPKRDQRSDVLPDDARRSDRARQDPPDSLAPSREDNLPDGGDVRP